MVKNRRLGFVFSALIVFSFLVVPAAVNAQPPCPPIIASLMPSNAVKVSGQYTPAGIMALGAGACDLPFENICANQTTKFPGRLTFDIRHFANEGVEIFKMQVGPEEQQRVASKKAELEKKLKANTSPDGASMKVEPLANGTLLYFEQIIDCSEGVKRTKPLVDLLAVAHTDNTTINLEVNGYISAAAARAAAMEVLSNFAKADFNALDKAQ